MAEPLIAEARIIVPDAGVLVDRLCAHFGEHATVSRDGSAGRIDSVYGTAHLEPVDGAMRLRIECPGESAFFLVKTSLIEHVFEFAAAPQITWTGHGTDTGAVPYFREMTVVAAVTLTPRMRRVTLKGDVDHFARGGLHVRLLMPPVGRAPRWPVLSPEGRLTWAVGEDAVVARVYTVRRIDLARGTLDLDIVIHDGHDTPGSTWALSAQPGAVVGLMGPGGGDQPPGRRLVLAGDETALPAIARIVEGLPAGARATVLVEVADAAEEQPLRSAADLDVTWLHRDGGRGFEDAVRAQDLPVDDPDGFVWIACEHTPARALRNWLRREVRFDRQRQTVAAYWRRGARGDEVAEAD
jgi:NADPH-dependent ferric siderophore reductase